MQVRPDHNVPAGHQCIHLFRVIIMYTLMNNYHFDNVYVIVITLYIQGHIYTGIYSRVGTKKSNKQLKKVIKQLLKREKK